MVDHDRSRAGFDMSESAERHPRRVRVRSGEERVIQGLIDAGRRDPQPCRGIAIVDQVCSQSLYLLITGHIAQLRCLLQPCQHSP